MVVSYNSFDRNETTRQNLAVEKWLAYKSEFLGMKTIKQGIAIVQVLGYIQLEKEKVESIGYSKYEVEDNQDIQLFRWGIVDVSTIIIMK